MARLLWNRVRATCVPSPSWEARMRRAVVVLALATPLLLAGCTATESTTDADHSTQPRQAQQIEAKRTGSSISPRSTRQPAPAWGPRLTACWRRGVRLQVHGHEVRMRGRNGPVITMRPGETADLRVSAPCRDRHQPLHRRWRCRTASPLGQRRAGPSNRSGEDHGHHSDVCPSSRHPLHRWRRHPGSGAPQGGRRTVIGA